LTALQTDAGFPGFAEDQVLSRNVAHESLQGHIAGASEIEVGPWRECVDPRPCLDQRERTTLPGRQANIRIGATGLIRKEDP
jgi:hypothetical protein